MKEVITMTLGEIFVATMIAQANGDTAKVKELNEMQNKLIAELKAKKKGSN